MTALMLAAAEGQMEVCVKLIELGAHLNVAEVSNIAPLESCKCLLMYHCRAPPCV